MSSPVYITDIVTTVPPQSYTQEEARAFITGLSRYTDAQKRFLNRIYEGTAIRKRHTVVDDYHRPPEEYTFYAPNADLDPEPGLEKRNDLFITHAAQLSQEAVRALLKVRADLDPLSITHLITVSCTGFSAPGFDFEIMRRIPLAPTVHRFHLGFMGCFAAFPALKLGHSICTADPTARVLIVNVELCSLHLQLKAETDMMVANALFADGVSATLMTGADGLPADRPAGTRGFRMVDYAGRVIDGSESDMAWRIGPIAFDMRLSAYVPKFIQKNIAEIVDDLLKKSGHTRNDVDTWAIHPGGRAILDRAATALDLETDAFADSYAVLGEYGNMSSATIFFVLQRILQRGGGGRVFAAAFGPGLTVESALLEAV
jgi:predicted naringenin-chalcone synthase